MPGWDSWRRVAASCAMEASAGGSEAVLAGNGGAAQRSAAPAPEHAAG